MKTRPKKPRKSNRISGTPGIKSKPPRGGFFINGHSFESNERQDKIDNLWKHYVYPALTIYRLDLDCRAGSNLKWALEREALIYVSDIVRTEDSRILKIDGIGPSTLRKLRKLISAISEDRKFATLLGYKSYGVSEFNPYSNLELQSAWLAGYLLAEQHSKDLWGMLQRSIMRDTES